MTAIRLNQSMIKEIEIRARDGEVGILAPREGAKDHLVLDIPDGVAIGDIDDVRMIQTGTWRISSTPDGLAYSRADELEASAGEYEAIDLQDASTGLEDLLAASADVSQLEDAIDSIAAHTADVDSTPQPDDFHDDPGYSPAMAARGRELAAERSQGEHPTSLDEEKHKRQPQGAGGISLGFGQLAAGAKDKIKAAANALNKAKPSFTPDPAKAIEAKVRETAKHVRDYHASVVQLADHYQHFQDASNPGDAGSLISGDTVNAAENHKHISEMRRSTSAASTRAISSSSGLMAALKDVDIDALIERCPSIREDLAEISNSANATSEVFSKRFNNEEGSPMSPLIKPMADDAKSLKERLADMVEKIKEMVSSIMSRFAP